MSLRVSLDRKYEYANGIYIVPVQNGADTEVLFDDADSTSEPKTVFVRRPGRRTGRRVIITRNTTPENFDPSYPTGEPADD